MAFQKTIDLPSGVSGNYIRVSAFRWDRAAREASVLFALYKDASTAAAGQPLRESVAKLRLEGAVFDTWLGNASLGNALEQIYMAARAVPVISDFGAEIFAGAVDV